MPNPKELNEALATLSNALIEAQNEKQTGLNMRNAREREEIQERNSSFTKFVKDFVDEAQKRSEQQRGFRKTFFNTVIAVFVLLNLISVGVIIAIAVKASKNITDIVTVTASFGTVLSSLVLLPKIIAKHLFPRVEQDKSIELFSKQLEEDREMRRYLDENKSKINDDES